MSSSTTSNGPPAAAASACGPSAAVKASWPRSRSIIARLVAASSLSSTTRTRSGRVPASTIGERGGFSDLVGALARKQDAFANCNARNYGTPRLHRDGVSLLRRPGGHERNGDRNAERQWLAPQIEHPARDAAHVEQIID